MTPNPAGAALLLIDMENAFITGAHRIAGAAATVPACVEALDTARGKGIPVFFVKRIYRADGSDVELTRYGAWKAAGRTCAPGSTGDNGADVPAELRPRSGDYTIIKPRWSAFFGTELDLILRRLGIRTVLLAGTTTPNCVRTTCYDALALEYQCVVLTDCTSSQTEEIERANLADMERVGAIMMTNSAFADFDESTVPDLSAELRADMDGCPEPFAESGGSTGWTDRW